MNNRVLSLDVLRAMAILSVLALHSLDFMSGIPPVLTSIFSFGWIGVDLFFVLSGFLIGLQAFQQNNVVNIKNSIKKFLIKRWFRTLPLYYFVLIFYVLIKPRLGFPFTAEPIQFIFLIQNFFSPKDFVQSWSLCIEEQFYLLFPLVYFGFKLKKVKKFYWLLPGFISMCYRFWLYKNGVSSHTPADSSYNYRFPFITHLDGISWGVFLASTFNTWSKYKNKRYILGLGCIFLLLSLSYIGSDNLNSKVILSFQLLSLSFSLILVGIYDLQYIPLRKVFEIVALWSYGLYLWNNVMVKIVSKVGAGHGNISKMLIFIFLSCFASALTYYFIEKPSLKWRDHFIRKQGL